MPFDLSKRFSVARDEYLAALPEDDRQLPMAWRIFDADGQPLVDVVDLSLWAMACGSYELSKCLWTRCRLRRFAVQSGASC